MTPLAIRMLPTIVVKSHAQRALFPVTIEFERTWLKGAAFMITVGTGFSRDAFRYVAAAN